MTAEGRRFHSSFIPRTEPGIRVLNTCQINDKVSKMYAFHNHSFRGTKMGVVLYLMRVLAAVGDTGSPGR